jgi:hypothetical protein
MSGSATGNTDSESQAVVNGYITITRLDHKIRSLLVDLDQSKRRGKTKIKE